MLKRILFFTTTLLFVFLTLACTTTLFGLQNHLTYKNIPYYPLLALFCIAWGILGAIFSLYATRSISKMHLSIHIIDPQHASSTEQELLKLIYELAQKKGLKKLPEVGIYQSPELNAFIIGPSKKHALLAISSSLLSNLNSAELTSIVSHEIAYLASNDMITMLLIQGVINAFTLFFAHLLTLIISLFTHQNKKYDPQNISKLTYSLLAFIFVILSTIFGSLVVTLFSRWRIYRADTEGAKLTGRENMIAALQRLRSATDFEDERAPFMAAFKITHQMSWFEIFSSHPSLAKRITRLQRLEQNL